MSIVQLILKAKGSSLQIPDVDYDFPSVECMFFCYVVEFVQILNDKPVCKIPSSDNSNLPIRDHCV